MDTHSRKRTGDGRAVSTVVALTAKNQRFSVVEIIKVALNGLQARVGSRFHEEQRWNAVGFDGEAIDLSNLFSENNGLHEGDDMK